MKYTPEHCYCSLVETFTPKDSPSQTTKNAWKYVLKDVSEEILKKATYFFIENWTTEPFKPRIPSQADFLKQCKLFEKDQQKTFENGDEEETRPLSKKEAAKLYKGIIREVSKKDKKEDWKDFDTDLIIYEFYSPGSSKYIYVCHGHVDKNESKKACYGKFMVKPGTVTYFYQRFKDVINRDKNGNYISKSTGFVRCSENDKNARPFTAGYTK